MAGLHITKLTKRAYIILPACQPSSGCALSCFTAASVAS
jgi:hypothetical protein